MSDMYAAKTLLALDLVTQREVDPVVIEPNLVQLGRDLNMTNPKPFVEGV